MVNSQSLSALALPRKSFDLQTSSNKASKIEKYFVLLLFNVSINSKFTFQTNSVFPFFSHNVVKLKELWMKKINVVRCGYGRPHFPPIVFLWKCFCFRWTRHWRKDAIFCTNYLIKCLGDSKLYLVAQHNNLTCRVRLSEVFARQNRIIQTNILNKKTKSCDKKRLGKCNKFVVNKPTVFFLDCCRQRLFRLYILMLIDSPVTWLGGPFR